MVESLLADREVLFFVHSRGCEACAVAQPELDRFMSKHPAMTVLALDAEGPLPAQLGLGKIRATPTYFLRRAEGVAKIEGALRAADLEKWLKKLGSGL